MGEGSNIQRRKHAQNLRKTQKFVKYRPCCTNIYIPISFNYYNNTIYFTDKETEKFIDVLPVVI